MNRIVTAASAIVAAIAVSAQTNVAVTYRVTNCDTDSGDPYSNEMTLVAGQGKSLYYNKMSLYVDSCNSTPEGKARLREVQLKAWRVEQPDGTVTYDGRKLGLAPEKSEYLYVAKNRDEGMLCVYDYYAGGLARYTEADGDMDKAVEFLREKGLAGATKKAGRIAAEGIVMTKVTADEKKAVVVEVNAETDFVAKNEKFQNYVSDVAEQALNTSAADIDAFLAEKWAKDPSLTVAEALSSQISIIGENMKIRRFAQLAEENGFVASYIHAGGKIGVLVDVETDVVNDAIKEMAKNVAMQAAALKPLYTNDSEVDADYIAKEKEILTVAAKNEKPDANDKIINGMVMGRIKKELKEICLLDQVYVKAEDGKQSVAQYVAQVAKENGAKITVKKFVRFETGEGIEKKEENFAEEVAKQMAQ